MANFPDNPTDGQQIVEPATDGTDRVAIWTYNSLNQQWTYEIYEVYSGDTAIYTDQVIVRQPDPVNYPTLTTQMDVNQLVGSELGLTGEYVVYTDQIKERGSGLTQAQINMASASAQTAVTQNVEEIQGTKSKSTWQFHGGPLPDDGVPAINQFWMADKENERTQEFCEAAFIRIHALGAQGQVTRDRVELGSAVVGDRLIIQNLADTDGCSYTITSVEEHGPVDGDYTKSYALYGVEPDPTYCIGTVSPAEIVSIKLKSAPTEGGGDYLPLTGGTVTGELHVNKPNNNSIFDVTAEKVEYQKHATSIEQLAPREIINVGILDNLMRDPGKFGYLKDYLPLAGGSMKGDIAMNGHRVTGIGDPRADSQAANKSYVDRQIAGIEIPEIPEIPDFELSTKDKLYLQGFYPFKFGEGTQINDPGEFLVKDYNYLVTQDPEKWKFLYFSTTDAYGQDLAGQFLNHMHMDAQHEGQVWICKENGYKLCGYIGKMRPRDQNFERYFNLEMDNTVQLLNPPNYDTQALRVDKGEVLWIKCSFWG